MKTRLTTLLSVLFCANTPIFYRIGLKNGSDIKISNISITYGTN